MNFKPRIITSNNGAALIISFLILVLLTMIATIAITMNIMEIKISNNHEESNKAFYDAESGIQHALVQLKVVTTDWTTSNSNFTTQLAGATSANPWVNFLSSGI